jgi:hypothetical protein
MIFGGGSSRFLKGDARDVADARHLHAAGEETAIHIGKLVCPPEDPCRRAIGSFHVHGDE